MNSNNMVTLQYFNGAEWIKVSAWQTEALAWWSLGDDNCNYRTVDVMGNVLTDKSDSKKEETPETCGACGGHGTVQGGMLCPYCSGRGTL